MRFSGRLSNVSPLMWWIMLMGDKAAQNLLHDPAVFSIGLLFPGDVAVFQPVAALSIRWRPFQTRALHRGLQKNAFGLFG